MNDLAVEGKGFSMALDQALVDRVRPRLLRLAGLSEKRMFGGIGFLLFGNMSVGVWKEFLILRVGPEKANELLTQPGTRVFDITGRPMAGWVMVETEAIETADALERFLRAAIDFTLTLPPKLPSTPRQKPVSTRRRTRRRPK